ncbi:MAG: M23 family metallopeptidase [Verrucomicrobiota bacterium]|nr:M23 family metallopeptidase [Verrucomicrobiota bacterium]
MRRARAICTAVVCAVAAAAVTAAEERAEPLHLALPTDNTALFSGGGPEFYQYITREYKGEKSTPWEGGQYGFVRNPVETSAGIVFTRFHEGIDIKPLRRDANGEPLDEVRAIADGSVVHVNLVPGYSNYGKYVVVEHRWGGAAYYSLYGHLASVSTSVGTRVARGDTLGILGYTGEGLDRARAHVHLELNLLLSREFEAWHAANFKNDPNHNGIYNGINLTGLDIAKLYLALRKQPSLTIPEFLGREEVFYKVTVPAAKNFDLPRRYPWMLEGSADANPPSWQISFNRAGVPLKIAPSQQSVPAAELSYFTRGRVNYSYLTRGVLEGSGDRAALSESGRRLMQLLTFPD